MNAAPGPARVRIARATRRLETMTRFYRDGLGLEALERFSDHAGYSGVILGLTGGVEIEITRHARGRTAMPPDPDDLLVIYLPTARHVTCARERLERAGHASVEPLNPYWLDRAFTFEDPDGWRIVLCADADR